MRYALIPLIFLVSTANADTASLKARVLDTAKSSLNYVLNSQGKGDGKVFKGEWENYIYLNHIKIPGRKEKSYLDSNIFVTSSIYDLLAEVYELDTIKFDFILPHLDLAITSFKSYHSDKSFNFWPVLPKKIKLNNYSDYENVDLKSYQNSQLGHRPTYFPLKNKFEINFTNIVNDADDTALAYRAIYRHKKYGMSENTFLKEADLFLDVEDVFDRFRDSDRHINHFYNSFVGNVRNSDAYLTWFGKEANIFNFFAKAIPINRKSNIPFGVNDVDCVVNANILNTLAITDRLDQADGGEHACKLIERAFTKNKSKVCGIYYPSEYTLHFSSSNAIKNGAKCLAHLDEKIISEILIDQQDDGSFISPWHDSDTIQSTAYALSSLINLTNDSNKSKLRSPITKGIEYILTQTKIDEKGDYYFKGGSFFSGGTIIRKKLIWISDPYTTALLTNILFRFDTLYL